MIFGSSNFLGLAVGDQAISCAEVGLVGGRRTVRRTATFSLSEELISGKPEAAGQALASFLRQNRFSASRGIVGVPAKWLIALEREVPPANEQELRGILRLLAERLSVSESSDMVFDYAGQADPDRPGRVLLVGMRREQLERIDAMMAAAGISVAAITPTSLVLASGAGQAQRDLPMLLLSSRGMEMVWQPQGVPRMLRHFAMVPLNGRASPPIGPLCAELKRAVALAPGASEAAISEVLLWDAVGLPEGQIQQLSERLGMRILPGRVLETLGVSLQSSVLADRSAQGPEQDGVPERFAPALALAIAAARREPTVPDFRHPRLAPVPQRRIGRGTFWAAVLGVAALASLISLYVIVQQRDARLDQLESHLSSLSGRIKSAEQMEQRVAYARGFFDARPAMLECLREVTQAFREDEQIWASSFSLRDNGKGQLSGKATDQRMVLGLLDRLQKNPRFNDVKVLEIREASGRNREWSFSMSFSFSG